MKIISFIAIGVLSMVTSTACHKDESPKLNDTESKLVGMWLTKQITIERSGQPAIVSNGFSGCYYLDLKNEPYPVSNTGLVANAKWAEDWKDCSKRLAAWKIADNGQLLLVAPSVDTVYADILILEKDTLAFRATNPSKPDEHITYEFR